LRQARRRGTVRAVAYAAASLLALTPAAASAAEPTLTPNAQGKGKVTWTDTVSVGTAEGGTTDDCFDSAGKPDQLSGCSFYKFRINTPAGFYKHFLGGVQIDVTGFSPFDVDMTIYRLKANGSHGDQAGASGNAPGEDETTTVAEARGRYIVAVVPFAAPPGTSYNGSASFNLRTARPPLAKLNKRIGAGPKNYRASHDRYISHSEPSIAMDPLNHKHLFAGSKMYENLGKYLFKAGTYESKDGGRTWKDYGQLPGYCDAPGQCDPTNEAAYRTVSDISMAFDDEGNSYANVLDAPGGTFAFTGFNMTIHVKRKNAKNWSQPYVVHDNRNTPVTEQLLLDDKNWVAVDNNTTTTGAPNKPHDGNVGSIYVCWGLDGTQAPTQQIVLMRSTDGGKTWGGVTPGDNTPYQLSQKSVISGIGCHIVIGPAGEVYVTWYDNQLDALMQVKSVDRGHSFTPARPVATILGENEQFERQSFRNLSIPTSGIDRKGNLYIAVASHDGEGSPVLEGTSIEQIKELRDNRRAEAEAEGDKSSGADIVLFKSTDGGNTYTGPVRVNQDSKKLDRDQFQPWLAVTPKGQVDVMYFDKRRDPNNFFLGETLSRSNDGGKHWKDTRVDHRMWDPRINPPISVSGQFIGDYQGLVADDKAAIPFWNDTQAANLKPGSKGYSPWQEVYAARIPNGKSGGGGKCRDRRAPKTSLPRKNVSRDASGRMHFHGTARDKGCKHKLKFVRVSIARYKHEGGKCRFFKRNGGFTKPRDCSKRLQMRAKGTKHWSFVTSSAVPDGKYRITASAVDRAGNREKPIFGRNTVKFRAR
jgi:photosystem II stability/assembly factor-like uncharacterized protein